MLPEGLKTELMPNHVAVIPDGNRRWAKERGLMTMLGHSQGRDVLETLIVLSANWGIKLLSLYCFSKENWKRAKEEVDFLMILISDTLKTWNAGIFQRYNIHASFMGDKSRLSDSLLETMNSVEEKTRDNSGLHVLIAINYSGQYEIMQATKRIAGKVKEGILNADDINEGVFDEELDTSCAEHPAADLLIRTGGEQRISNFMLWQLAYTELIFSDKMFPDFGERDYVAALLSFQKRDRRFGGNI